MSLVGKHERAELVSLLASYGVAPVLPLEPDEHGQLWCDLRLPVVERVTFAPGTDRESTLRLAVERLFAQAIAHMSRFRPSWREEVWERIAELPPLDPPHRPAERRDDGEAGDE